MSAEELYSIKMRASKKENGTDVHISGAEKIVDLFKTKGVGQKILAGAIDAPVSVMETAGVLTMKPLQSF